jgi:hypothetical protein
VLDHPINSVVAQVKSSKLHAACCMQQAGIRKLKLEWQLLHHTVAAPAPGGSAPYAPGPCIKLRTQLVESNSWGSPCLHVCVCVCVCRVEPALAALSGTIARDLLRLHSCTTVHTVSFTLLLPPARRSQITPQHTAYYRVPPEPPARPQGWYS